VRRYEGAAVSAYRPPTVAELSPRESAQVQAALVSVSGRLHQIWQSYLGPQAELGDWRIAGDVDADGGLGWQWEGWRGGVRIGDELQHGIIAAATGFDEATAPCNERPGPVATAVLRTVLAALLRSLLGAFGQSAGGPLHWRSDGDAGAAPGVTVRAAGRAAGVPGEIAWRLPLALIRQPSAPPSEEEQERLHTAVSDAEMAVEAVVPGPRISAEELAGLAPGDIVLLGNDSVAEVSVIVAGRAIARGQPGLKSDRLAIRITEMPLMSEVQNGDRHR
jgi:flagellar motor switch/type III secretory pathway protein FliN